MGELKDVCHCFFILFLIASILTLSLSLQINVTLMQEVDTLAKTFEELQEQNSSLLSQLTEAEDSTSQLELERLKSLQTLALLRQERDALAQKLAAQEELLKTQTTSVADLQARVQSLQECVEKGQEESAARSALIESLRKASTDQSLLTGDCKTQLEQTKQSLTEILTTHETLLKSVEAKEKALLQLHVC